MQLGMIGLGRMGNNMVRRLLKAGTSVLFTISIRRPSKRSSRRGRSGPPHLKTSHRS